MDATGAPAIALATADKEAEPVPPGVVAGHVDIGPYKVAANSTDVPGIHTPTDVSTLTVSARDVPTTENSDA